MQNRTETWPNQMGVDVFGDGWQADVFTGHAGRTSVTVYDDNGDPWRRARFEGEGAPQEAAERAVVEGEVDEAWAARHERAGNGQSATAARTAQRFSTAARARRS